MRTYQLWVGIALAVICLLVTLATDIWHTPESTPPSESSTQPDDCRPGVLRIGVREKLTPINPLTIRDGYSAQLSEFLFDGLMRFNTVGELAYNLAESHKTQDDGRVYIFSLRPGIKFHDGADLTAKDIVFSYKAYRDGLMRASRRSEHLRHLQNIIAVDSYTVRFIFAESTPAFISVSSMYEILPQHLLSDPRNREPFGQEPIGTGPFAFESWRTDGGATLVANRHYHQVSPKLDRIVIKVIPKEEDRWRAFVLNTVDMVDYATENTADQLRDSGLAKSILIPQMLSYALVLNPKLPPTDRLDVREAILHSLDGEQICTRLTNYRYSPSYSFFSNREATSRPRERTVVPSQMPLRISLFIGSRDERQRDIALALRQQLDLSGFHVFITSSQQVPASDQKAFNACLVPIPSVRAPARIHTAYWSQHILGPDKLLGRIGGVNYIYEEANKNEELLKKDLLRIEHQIWSKSLATPLVIPLVPFIYSPRVSGDFHGYFRSFCSAAAVLNWQAN